MDDLSKKINKIVQAYKNEYGADAIMEDGEEVAAVFNDGVIIISKEGTELKINVTCGTPYKFDENIFKEYMKV